jgi:hypothetical protein
MLTGTVSGASLSAGLTAPDLSTGAIAATALSFTQTTNANVGVYAGTHDNPITRGLPGTWAFGVNADNTVHGFVQFLRNNNAVPPVALPTPYLLDGVIDPVTGALGLPAGVPVPFATINPGLVMTDDTGSTSVTPGTFSGTIAAITSGAGGTWQSVTIAPPLAPAITNGTFTGSLLP